MGGVAVRAIGIEIILGVVLFLLLLLKLSFRRLQVKGEVTATPEEIHHASDGK